MQTEYAEVAEYGQVADQGLPVSKRTTLAEKPGRLAGMYWMLIHRSAGYQCAGSAMIYVREAWGSIFTCRDGANGGQWFKTEAEAQRMHGLR
jgi:hypothetical protein